MRPVLPGRPIPAEAADFSRAGRRPSAAATLLAGTAPRIAPPVLTPGKQHHAGMPSPHRDERAFAVQQAVTRIQAYVRLGTRLKTASGGRVSDLSG